MQVTMCCCCSDDLPAAVLPLGVAGPARLGRGGNTYILHELLADGADVLGEGGGEHHDLLLVWGGPEYLLHVTPHVCNKKISQYLKKCHFHIENRYVKMLHKIWRSCCWGGQK
jgi:hypothetical protein